MNKTRTFIEDLKEIQRERKRKDILEIFEKKKTTLVKIAPHKKHPKPINKHI